MRAPWAGVIPPFNLVFNLGRLNGHAAQVAGVTLAASAKNLPLSLRRQERRDSGATLVVLLLRHLATVVGLLSPLAAIVIPTPRRVNPPVSGSADTHSAHQHRPIQSDRSCVS